MFCKKVLLYLYLCFASCKLKDLILRWFAFHPSKIQTYQFQENQQYAQNTSTLTNNLDSQIQVKANTMSYSVNNNEIIENQDTIEFQKVSRGPSIDLKPSVFLEVDQMPNSKTSQIFNDKINNNRRNYDIHYDVYIIRQNALRSVYRKIPNDIDIQGYFLDVNGLKIAVMVLVPLTVESKYVIIHSHPNQPDMGDMFDLYVKLCYNLGVTLIGYDYPGFGLSQGKPTEQNIYDSIKQVFQFALSLNFDQKHIILYGHSIGSGPTIFMASQMNVAGVILHSGFKSLLNVVCQTNEDYQQDAFKNFKLIEQIRCPIYMLHGKNDQLIPIEQAIQMSQGVRNLFRFWQIQGAGHNNIEHIEEYQEEYLNNLTQFVKYIEQQ